MYSLIGVEGSKIKPRLNKQTTESSCLSIAYVVVSIRIRQIEAGLQSKSKNLASCNQDFVSAQKSSSNGEAYSLFISVNLKSRPILGCQIRNLRLWNPELSQRNLESRLRLESGIQVPVTKDPESRIQDFFAALGARALPLLNLTKKRDFSQSRKRAF